MKDKIKELLDDALERDTISLSTYYDILDYVNLMENRIVALTKENKELKKNAE